ncbi:hypothetical protein FH972_023195 [Carpinus fangiana]|uniref:EamA domain-containing protein n=1 Tax=Carpinus fangiana TaxID=176857 RepID=A0A5N6KUI0_9ROSI|nr:hypothetical protein FH972_023195 [Carpinus fangiana]
MNSAGLPLPGPAIGLASPDANLNDLDSKPRPESHYIAPAVTASPATSLGVPLVRRRSRSPDASSLVTNDDDFPSELRRIASNRSPPLQDPTTFEDEDLTFAKAAQRSKPEGGIAAFWSRNKGVFLVLTAQVFGCLMNVTTRLLENPTTAADGHTEQGMHPFQILFARMSITVVCASGYMWWQSTPDFPLGARDVRWLLVARGLGGFWGVFGLYWSLQYLSLSDATVLTFLGPVIACWACSKLINEPFTRVEQLGAAVSLVGVVFIARPASIFATGGDAATGGDEVTPPAAGGVEASRRLLFPRADGASPSIPEATPQQRLAAVGMAMVGVVGAAIAFTTIRWIGRRAHPLVSVNYFATWCTIVSAFFLLCIPSVPFVLPHSARQWLLLFFIGVSGFAMQYLLTAGLRYEKSSRSTNMVYSQMLFALLFDRIVWGIVPDAMSWVGSSLILGSAIVVAIQKESTKKTETAQEGPRDEEVALIEDQEEHALPLQNMETARAAETQRR